MFFYIGDDCPIKSMKQFEPRLYLDDGWSEKNGIWFKGYSTECVLKDALGDIVNGYQPEGKWCVIKNEKIYHPKLRGFPVNNQGSTFTNLSLPNFKPVEYSITLPYKEDSPISMDEASVLIGDVLRENLSNFMLYNDFPSPEVIISGGLDTTTIWAVLDHITKDYSINLYLPQEKDVTVVSWMGCIREYTSDLVEKISADYWGYQHLPLRNEVVCNMGGYYAETIQYRDTVAMNALANYKGKWIDEIAKEEDYLYWFLNRPVSNNLKKEMLMFSNSDHLKRYLYDTVFYDFQMWHIDNNFTVSPFYDIRIPYIMNRLSIDDMVENALTGKIQKNIIARFKPELLVVLADYKNTRTSWDNFINYFDRDAMLHPNTKLIYR